MQNAFTCRLEYSDWNILRILETLFLISRKLKQVKYFLNRFYQLSYPALSLFKFMLLVFARIFHLLQSD